MKAEISASLRSAELYWDTAAESYDKDFSGTSVGIVRREAVWRDLQRAFHSGQRILELSCGTGIDAMFLAHRGVHILGLDLSHRMISIAQERAARALLPNPPEFRVLATEHLSTLERDGPFDGAFANFAGLNCVDDLSQVADTLGRLLKPNSRLLLCMMGRFVPLEILWFLARRNPRKAFQRLRESRNFLCLHDWSCHQSAHCPANHAADEASTPARRLEGHRHRSSTFLCRACRAQVSPRDSTSRQGRPSYRSHSSL